MKELSKLMNFRSDVRVVDATLRDGGLVNDFRFSDEFVRDLYLSNIKAGVDYMEFGYRADKEMFKVEDFGPCKFCDDEYILKTNIEFLGHDYYTDIITFDYSTARRVAGDMVISLDTVRSNAEQCGARYDDELCRVVIHGVLHLCGINDKGPGEREIMEQHENAALDLRPQCLIPTP